MLLPRLFFLSCSSVVCSIVLRRLVFLVKLVIYTNKLEILTMLIKDAMDLICKPLAMVFQLFFMEGNFHRDLETGESHLDFQIRF